MNLKNLFTINAVVALLFGIVDLFMPGTVVELMAEGAQATPFLKTSVRATGAFLLGFGVMSWFMRDAHLSIGRRAGIFGLAVGNLAIAIVHIMATTSGVMNNMGWSGAILGLALFAGFGYYANKEHTQIIEREAKEKVKA